MIHHAVGDAFSLEHIYLVLVMEFAELKELLAMPGVYVLIWDNCAFGEEYRHRQC